MSPKRDMENEKHLSSFKMQQKERKKKNMYFFLVL